MRDSVRQDGAGDYPQSETKIVERLGRYYATLQPGINIIIPFIDRAKSIVVLNHGRLADEIINKNFQE